MRITVIMLFVCFGLAYATESYSQSATLSLNVNNKTVQEVLDEIEKQSEFHFFYNKYESACFNKEQQKECVQCIGTIIQRNRH